MNTADLDIILISDGLKLLHTSSKLRESNVDGGTESCTQVSRTRGNIAKVLVVSETSDSLDVCSSLRKAGKDSSNISSILHRNYTKLIFLIDPHKESLGIIMEDTSASWPVSVKTASIKESISFLE